MKKTHAPKRQYGISNISAEEYMVMPSGQAAFIKDFLKELSIFPKVLGAYYFYPDYIQNLASDHIKLRYTTIHFY